MGLAAYLCRLAAPLCYNYLLLIHEAYRSDTGYSRVMGNMDVYVAGVEAWRGWQRTCSVVPVVWLRRALCLLRWRRFDLS